MAGAATSPCARIIRFAQTTCLTGDGIVLQQAKPGALLTDSPVHAAAWKAVIREGRIAEWQVFADNKRCMKILDKRKR